MKTPDLLAAGGATDRILEPDADPGMGLGILASDCHVIGENNSSYGDTDQTALDRFRRLDRAWCHSALSSSGL